MPDYQRSQKEHDALGGVYDALEETSGDAESREAHMRGHAESELAWEYEEEGREWDSFSPEWKAEVDEAVEEMRLTYPVEEHTYVFVRDPDATTRVPKGQMRRRGKRATEWLIYTSKRPDGTWYGSIQRFTEKQVEVDAWDTIMHDRPFEQEHAASERALLDDLIDHTHRWARRQNPREYPRYVSSHGGREAIWNYLGRDILVYPDPDPDTPGTWVAEWSDPDCGCYFDGKTEQEALTMARDGIDEADAALAVALKTLKKKNPRKAKKAKTSALFRRLMRI